MKTEDIYEACAQIVEAYVRPAFPGMEGMVKIVKADIAYRIRKAAKNVRHVDQADDFDPRLLQMADDGCPHA